MKNGKVYNMIPHATATVCFWDYDDDAVLDNILMLAKQSHDARKEHARYTHRANGTHPRDHADTLKHNRERRGEKLYNKAGLNRKRKNADKRETQAEIDLVFANKHHGFGYIEDAELFYDAGYDAGYLDACADACEPVTEEATLPMPWENLELVLYLFDDAASFICKSEKLMKKYATELNLMRAALEHAVHKLSTTTLTCFFDIIWSEEILTMLLGDDGVKYMLQLSQSHLLYTVAHNLFALYEQPELYQYYLDFLQNRDANCE